MDEETTKLRMHTGLRLRLFLYKTAPTIIPQNIADRKVTTLSILLALHPVRHLP